MSAETIDTSALQVVALDGTCRLTREDIGGKAWGINRMCSLGLPVPPAIALTIQACREHQASRGTLSAALWDAIVRHMRLLEERTGRRFGAPKRPLLVSVRSGGVHSMPGMMDTVLNVGINAVIEAGLRAESGNARYAAETHRRFAEQYRKVVLGDRAEPLPEDPWMQLRRAVAAVFDSWYSPRAQLYRGNRGLPEEGCTAVTIQAMVFGNLDERSGTGVLFSRSPITGDPPAWGEWLACGQGEEVVSGRYTPQPLDALRELMPQAHADLMRAAATLEVDARDIQDIEFTVESGRLWLLQSRVAKRSPQAAVRAAVALAQEGLISKEEALHRLGTDQMRKLAMLRLAPQAAAQPPLARGEPACPGIATGVVVADPEEAQTRARGGEEVVLARTTTSPEDLHGMIAARGVMTEQGGATSHAAVLSRELGLPCVVGCGANTVTALVGRRVTLDGGRGTVWAGDLTLDAMDEHFVADVRTLLEWGMPLIPLRLLRIDEAGPDAVDLDALQQDWRNGLTPGATFRGRVLDTDAGIRAAMAAGVRAAVVRQRLPALVACLQSESTAKRENARSEGVTNIRGGEPPELTLLRLVALKGRGNVDVLADALGLAATAVQTYYLSLCDRALCAKRGDFFQLSDEGRRRLALLLAQERENVQPAAVAELYTEFLVFNAELKRIMTAWQVKDEGALNDHSDASYDYEVLRQLANLHERIGPLLDRLPQLTPRLAMYRDRLARAYQRLSAGDRSYFAKIIVDSYHTVWFELHEELLALAGLKRTPEA